MHILIRRENISHDNEMNLFIPWQLDSMQPEYPRNQSIRIR